MRADLVVTTSLKPKEPARRFAKFLSFISKNAIYYKRGKSTIAQILSKCTQWSARKLIVINQMKNGTVLELRFYQIKKGKAIEDTSKLRVWNIIDNKIFGFRRFPSGPPISTGDAFQIMLPDMTQLLQKYFGLQVRRKTELWVHVDVREDGSILQFVDALTLRPFYEFRFSLLTNKQVS